MNERFYKTTGIRERAIKMLNRQGNNAFFLKDKAGKFGLLYGKETWVAEKEGPQAVHIEKED